MYPTLGPASASGAPAAPPPLLYFAAWFAVSLLFLPLRLYQMFGVLGWLDTPAPVALLLVYVVGWGVLLFRLPRVRKIAAVCGIFGIVILPSAIETAGWGSWPWWQGRYTLPFALGFGLLLLLRSGQLIPRTISAVSGIAVLSLGLMVWVNAIRYNFGLNDFGLPVSLAQQGLSPARLLLSAAIGTLLMLASGFVLVQAWRMEPDARSRFEPEPLSTPAAISVDGGANA
jgi:hypothetical protein